MASTQSQKILLGEAGEHLVVSRLLSHGYVAGQLPRTYRADDVYAEAAQGLLVHIQVKTTQNKARSWVVGPFEVSPTRFYAFVHLYQVDAPTVFVLPSQEVRSAMNLHERLYFEAHPGTQRGVPGLADPFRAKAIYDCGYPPGWLDRYAEAWALLPPAG